MMKKLMSIAVVSGTLLFTAGAYAAMDNDAVMVGGAAMYPQKNIVENALNSKDHTTLVAAVKAAGQADQYPHLPCGGGQIRHESAGEEN